MDTSEAAADHRAVWRTRNDPAGALHSPALAHDVSEAVPFEPLDSLAAVDTERFLTLVEALTVDRGSLLVALPLEDAAALPDDYERISEICVRPRSSVDEHRQTSDFLVDRTGAQR